MFKALFNVLFSVITAIVNVILTPINLLVANLFPDLNSMLNSFNYVLDNYLGSGISYFFSFLPPGCRSVIIIYLTFLVSYYTISISAHAIMKVYTIIKNIKIW